MEALSVYLFERIGLLLVFAFLLTRIPSFRYLLEREYDLKVIIYHSVVFGIFAIAGAQAGVIVSHGEMISRIWVTGLQPGEMLVGASLVAIVIAGLLGGPYVGLGSGCIAAVYLFLLGGEGQAANSLVQPLSGLLAGFTARFFSQERVISPAKALFIGMFAPILHMFLLLIFTPSPDETVMLVNLIGIPLVMTNSIAIAIFTAMIRIALNEQEQGAAMETKRALKIAEQALPHLRQGFNRKTAEIMAGLLYEELGVTAVSITNTEHVLAHIGLGADHHREGEPIKTGLSSLALSSGRIEIAYHRQQIQCEREKCPLQAGIIVPISRSGDVVGLIKLYFRRPQQITPVEVALAQGLGTLISNQLNAVAAEQLKHLLKDAEMRNLQSQIHPHFLFNTLHLIAVLIRIDQAMARHITAQLGDFIRMNLKLTANSLVPLTQELAHLSAYLEIVKVRFSEQLSIDCQVAEGLGDVLIPPFTLQPLVENSIQHGLKNAAREGRVRISIRRHGDRVRIEVRDNGAGISPELLDTLGNTPLKSSNGSNGIGVYNVNQRLIGLLGKESALRFGSPAEGGCVVHFSIPYGT